MPKLAANLSMMFADAPFLDRFAAAAGAGFRGVEFLFPYEHAPQEVAERLSGHDLELALFNLPPGNWMAGERGLAALPGRENEFDSALARALPYAEALRPRCIHVMAGIPPAGANPAACRASFIRNLRRAAEELMPLGIRAVIEPINRRDMPGYYLTRQSQAIELLDETRASNTGLQMDLYHCQIEEGDLAIKIRDYLARIEHMQIAGVPERQEPDTGEINYPYLFDLLDSLGYEGWVGCEYHPRGRTTAGLAWAAPYLHDFTRAG